MLIMDNHWNYNVYSKHIEQYCTLHLIQLRKVYTNIHIYDLPNYGAFVLLVFSQIWSSLIDQYCFYENIVSK